MPDGVFNGVEVLWIAGIVLAIVFGRWCLRRHEVARQRENSRVVALEGRDHVRIPHEQASQWTEWDRIWPRRSNRKEREAA